MKYFVFAKQNDNNPEIELWIESHKSERDAELSAEEYTINSFESSYITVTSKGFNTSLEAKKWLDKFKTGSMI